MMNENIAKAEKVLGKAKESTDAAVHSMEGDFILAAVNRAYYAMFYCMTALLYTKDMYAKTHQGTRVKFRELFIKDSLIDPAFSAYVESAFNSRQQADYDLDTDITAEEAQTIITNAKAFYETTRNYLLPFTVES